MRSRYALLVVGVVVVFYAYGGPMRAQNQQPSTTPGGAPVAQVPGSLPSPGTTSTPAVVTTTVPSPAAPAHAEESIIWALAASYVLEWIKKQKQLAFLTPETPATIQAFFGLMAAAFTAAGIHFAVQGSMLDNSGLSFTVTGVTFNAFKDVIVQWVVQQGWYDAIVKSRSTNVVVPVAAVTNG